MGADPNKPQCKKKKELKKEKKLAKLAAKGEDISQQQATPVCFITCSLLCQK